ncbi:MAG: PAS domain S-box protein [Blastocatellia bacterium]|nr:PAS domain S-box protein [Blastocatellia bacterium]
MPNDDWTARKEPGEAEETLHKSVFIAEGLFEAAPDAIVVVDSEGRIVRINRQAEAMFGYSRVEAIGKYVEILIPERYKDRHPRYREGYVRDPHTRPMGAGLELYGKRRDGSEFPIDINLAPLQVGDVLLVLSIIRDISERKQVEEALRLSEAKFSGILSIAADAIISIDESQRITLFNEGAEKIFGYSKDEISGKPLDMLIPEKFRDLHAGHVRDFAESPIAARRMGERREIFALRSGGEEFPAEASISKLEIFGEKIYTVVLRDITDRKLAEEELRKAHDELEIRVRERTAELVKANEALQAEIAERQRAEERIIASLEEKEVLLKEVHHRVKNNLQVISSLLNLQSRYIQDQTTLDIFKDSQNRVKSMALMHEQLYKSSNLAEIEIGKYIQELVNHLSGSYGDNPAHIRLKIEAEDIRLDIDTAIPCGLIINELVSNSLKHAFPDGRKGQVKIDLHSADDNEFALTISDNGIGFPESMDFKSTRSLGLRIVNSLVDQLKGKIELGTGQGTEFRVAFKAIKYEKRI